jgi:sugar phosphate isomerase/epimerase
LALAARHGFEGYHFGIHEAVQLGAGRVRDLAAARGVQLSSWGFPLDFRGGQAAYENSLKELPALAMVAAELGVRRTPTWLMPCSDDLTFAQNFAFHVERLKPAAAILAEHGIWLGLEYVSPRTSWTSKKYPFVHTMAQMRELASAIGPNVGFLLDSWHWYCARETPADLRQLRPEQVVDVHLNDAPDRPVDEQIDSVRALPGETGVIDLAGFLGALRQIGYGGPVMVEPFSDRVRAMGPDEACAATAAALAKVWPQAGR